MTKQPKPRRSFASDNNAGVHPKIMEAIAAANDGHVIAYGGDPYTAGAVKSLRNQLGKDAEVFFVFGGTGANVLGLKASTESHQAIICAETAHINVNECGAPEKFTGCKLIVIATSDGKLNVDQIKPLLH
ncbi:MAG TPA: beta-eliminating lyase-related protein, partial [Pyrinomonadaceae bacterium]|nr:beta-eliminating lyase-related protein [Pyrinomonadaceae bacterium]